MLHWIFVYILILQPSAAGCDSSKIKKNVKKKLLVLCKSWGTLNFGWHWKAINLSPVSCLACDSSPWSLDLQCKKENYRELKQGRRRRQRQWRSQKTMIWLVEWELNSSPIDELGNWWQERLVGTPRKYEAQQGGFHDDPVSGNQPCQWPPTGTVTLMELQWKYLPNAALTWVWLSTRVGRAG